jgi:hypothetical protein
VLARSAKASWFQFAEMSVRSGPGITALTRTRGSSASAKATVMPLSPAFDAAYGMMSPVERIAPMPADIDDRPTVLAHAGADQGSGPEGTLEVDAEGLVPQLLDDLLASVIQR